MKAVIDTLFNPIIDWLVQIRMYLAEASVPLSQALPIDSIFAPIAMLSPSWQLLVTNIFALCFIYLIIYIVRNATGLLESLRGVIKWW